MIYAGMHGLSPVDGKAGINCQQPLQQSVSRITTRVRHILFPREKKKTLSQFKHMDMQHIGRSSLVSFQIQFLKDLIVLFSLCNFY